MVRLLLESTDHHVLEARGGLEALEVARAYRGHIDLLLADVDMPGMDGLELARQFARYRPRTSVVYMSVHSSALARNPIIDERAILAKPLRARALISKVREVIRAGGRI